MMHRWGLVGSFAFFCVSVSSSSCGDLGGPRPWTVTDSAGIQIVASDVSAAPRWEIGPHPVRTLGSLDGDGPEQFDGVVDVEILHDGGVAVALRGSDEVRLFDASGQYLRRFGGRGRGPGEFAGLSHLEELGDSLLTYDDGNGRLSLWQSDGTLVRSSRLSEGRGFVLATGILANGEVVAIAPKMPGSGLSGVLTDSASAMRFSSAGELLDSLAPVPFRQRVTDSGGTSLDAPFTAWVQLTMDDDGLCYAFGPSPDLNCHGATGTLRRIIRIMQSPRVVSESHIEGFWSEREAAPASLRRDAFLSMRRAMPFPSLFPTYAQLLRDSDDRLWARLYPLPQSTEQRWLVFEAGRLVGVVTTPSAFQVMDVEGAVVAGVWKDDLDVEFVHLYELGRVAPPDAGP